MIMAGDDAQLTNLGVSAGGTAGMWKSMLGLPEFGGKTAWKNKDKETIKSMMKSLGTSQTGRMPHILKAMGKGFIKGGAIGGGIGLLGDLLVGYGQTKQEKGNENAYALAKLLARM
jgi:hypothetical protein